MMTAPRGIYDPPYVGACSSDPTAPTCSVFLESNTYVNHTPPCSQPWYYSDFPPHPDGNAVLYDVMLPHAVSTHPASCNVARIIWWLHFQSLGIFAPWGAGGNFSVWFTNPGGSTLIARGGFSLSDGDTSVGLWFGTFTATTAAPVRLQLQADLGWSDPVAGPQPFEMGMGLWSNEWCATPPTVGLAGNWAAVIG